MNVEHIQAIVQILPESTQLYVLLQVLVRCHEDTNINLDVPLAPQPRELTILKNLEQLCLKRRADFGNLVKKYRPPMGQLELAGFSVVGSSERSLFVTKKFALQEFFGQGRTVDLDEGLLFSR